MAHDVASRDKLLTNGIDDMTTGCVMQRRVLGMTIDTIAHVDGAAPKDMEEVGPATPMLAWHHVAPDKMIEIDPAVRRGDANN